MEWFSTRLVPVIGEVSIVSLLVTLIVLFTLQSYLIIELPAIIRNNICRNVGQYTDRI